MLFNLSKKKINDTQCYLIYKNNLIENIYEACSCCYDNTKELSYLEKKKYVGKRISAGHESILEHGRLAMILRNIPSAIYNNIIELTSSEFSKWLEFYSLNDETQYFDTYDIIINGSIRGYKHFINNITPNVYDNNILVRKIINVLEKNTVAELYGKLNEELEFNFVDIETGVEDVNTRKSDIVYSNISNNIIDIPTTNKDTIKSVELGIDLNELIHLSDQYGIYLEKNISYKIIPVTIVFRNMSRTATHQLVRHRNAITQESQRYVNASNASFTIPVPEYNPDKIYSINIAGNKINANLNELAKELLNVYTQLQSQGLKKEEARAFLPSNVNCSRLYMTFTLESLIAFLNLRLDPHAQYEIRKYAEAINNIIDSYQINKT